MQEFNWAQDKINMLTDTEQNERHAQQLNEIQESYNQLTSSFNRAQRRELEKMEKRIAKKTKV